MEDQTPVVGERRWGYDEGNTKCTCGGETQGVGYWRGYEVRWCTVCPQEVHVRVIGLLG